MTTEKRPGFTGPGRHQYDWAPDAKAWSVSVELCRGLVRYAPWQDGGRWTYEVWFYHQNETCRKVSSGRDCWDRDEAIALAEAAIEVCLDHFHERICASLERPMSVPCSGKPQEGKTP